MAATPSLILESEKYYLLRKPLLPLQTVLDLNEQTRQEPARLGPALLHLFRDEQLQEAIYTASPELYAELHKVLAKGLDPAGKDDRLVATLYKYLIRMSMRCTPYGLFAGCASGELAETTTFDFAGAPPLKQSRLDMNYVNELVQHLLTTTEVKYQLRYFPNNSLYAIADSYRYVEYKVKNKRRHYSITSVRKSSYLEVLLQAAGLGIHFARLVELIQAEEPEATPAEAQAYIEELIDSQLLISELEPTITGAVFFEGLPQKLAGKVAAPVVAQVAEIQQLLEAGGVRNFQQVHQLINTSFGQSSSKDLIQTDLFFKPESNTLKTEVIETVTSQLSELFALANKTNLPDLERFKKDFVERFEDREVPLLLALDSETGVGYGRAEAGRSDHLPLLDGITPRAAAAAKSSEWKKYTQLVHRLFRQAAATGAQTVELTPADLAGLEEKPDLGRHTPASLYAFGSLLASSPAALDAGDFRFALGVCSAPSAANLLGRFCYGDTTLLDNVKASLQRAEPDTEEAVYAEVVHLPEARIGNILMRPHLRTYEIPFLGLSAAPAEHQITVQDLRVSVRQGQLVLRSARLNKRVIPRLSSAHNYTTGLPIYRFLCDLQKHDIYFGVSWYWDNLSSEPFLPRVQYRNIILTKATWHLTLADLQPGDGRKKTLTEAALQQQLVDRKLPRFFCLTDHDNELLIDSHHAVARQLVVQQLEKKGRVTLTEFLATPDNCPLQGPGNTHYANELLLPLYNGAYVPPGTPARALPQPEITRSFAPGSEWLYLKLYAGTKTMDRVLTEKIRPLVAQLLAEGIIDKWFFIRYNDPHHHLRVRFHVPVGQESRFAQVVQAVQQALAPELAEGLVHKLQLDTYVRELERYGAANMENSESLFYHDSQAIANVLNLLEGDEGETYRWLLALRGLDELLTDFGLELAAKRQVLQQLSEAFFQEFNGDKSLQVQLNEKYRQESRRIRSFLNPAEDDRNGIEEATHEFLVRRRESRETVAAIQALYPQPLPASAAGFSLLASYVHMYVNRFVLSKSRLHELTLYGLLHKHYTAQTAMEKKTISGPKIVSYAL